MGAATLAFVGAALAKPRTDRIFHYITAAIAMVATISYFSLGSNLGWAPIGVEFLRNRRTVASRNREIFYVRYID
jgi:bacteriorhodopsin